MRRPVIRALLPALLSVILAASTLAPTGCAAQGVPGSTIGLPADPFASNRPSPPAAGSERIEGPRPARGHARGRRKPAPVAHPSVR